MCFPGTSEHVWNIFGVKTSRAINAPIEFCPWSDLFPEDTPIVEGGEESLTVVNGEEVQTAIEAIDPSFHV
jgi:hypothetical protein